MLLENIKIIEQFHILITELVNQKEADRP
jgi:hypothetical protein